MKIYTKSFITLIAFLIFAKFSFSQNKEINYNNIPFSTDTSHITIWNGEKYIPFFIKGINFGVAVPGKFPGELSVSREQYGRWFKMIKEAGYSSIRLYTLHYPHFYEVLDSFNTANPQNPLFFFQGVWLEEELEGFTGDLYFLTDFFSNEIEENIDCLHGNKIIEQRLGKAWGTYTIDVSKWLIGYIIGRETYPQEIILTNENHASITNFIGNYLSITGCSPAEAWITARLNHLIEYENINYETQHPVSYSSWPTLDPLAHPFEGNEWEDVVSIDLATIDITNAPAGVFISYHAYPYYPDFISDDPLYQEFNDDLGQNSYLGYLTYLKNHYNNFPLIIAEFGVPSSWGVAHYTMSDMNHGGQDEIEQGNTDLRLFKNIEDSDCAGGIEFSWIDEWFKRTWITDPIDYMPDRRILWHNITAAEQNFGLIKFNRPLVMETIENYPIGNQITEIKAGADNAFLYLNLQISEPFVNLDEMWIGFDTYNSDLGESILPEGQLISNRAEFALKITNYSAQLYVTQAYDLFGIWHGTSEPEQLYHSIATDGAPWNIVRWKNNNGDEDVQFIGNLKVNHSFFPENSEDAVTVFNDHLEIKIPWSLLQFVAPSEMIVFNDDRNTPQPESTTSDGIKFSVFYKDFSAETTNRFTWDFWNTCLDVVENKKTSYFIMKNGLTDFNNPAIAIADSLNTENGYPFIVNSTNGILKNDFDLDGDYFESLLLENTQNGNLNLELDGSFTYLPKANFSGIDSFTYCIYDNYSLSSEAKVYIYVDEPYSDIFQITDNEKASVIVFPNPVTEFLTIKSSEKIEELKIFDYKGQEIKSEKLNSELITINVSDFKSGIYFVKSNIGKNVLLNKVMVLN